MSPLCFAHFIKTYEYIESRTTNAYGQPLQLQEEEPVLQASPPHLSYSNSCAMTSIEGYSSVVDYNADRAAYANLGDWLSIDNDKREAEGEMKKEVLYKRSMIYSVSGVASFGVLAIIAVSIYTFKPLRARNIALMFAFIGLITFVTFMSIAFLTVHDIGAVNSKAVASAIAQKGKITADVAKRDFSNQLFSDRIRLGALKATLSLLLRDLESEDRK